MRTLTFKKLRDVSRRRDVEWNGKSCDRTDLLFAANEMAGEVGEACNVVKKLERARLGIAGGITDEVGLPALAEEIADVVICANRMAESLGIDLAATVAAKFNKTSEKYGLKSKIE